MIRQDRAQLAIDAPALQRDCVSIAVDAVFARTNLQISAAIDRP